MFIDIEKIIKDNGIDPKGVFHVGAHKGQELSEYENIGFKTVCMVEANPEVYGPLKELKSNVCELMFFNYAISNEYGNADFHVTANFKGGGEMSSSLLELKRHKIIYPNIHKSKTIKVQTITLDELVTRWNIDARDFNMINLDIQGAELLALEGALDVLKNIDIINTEINNTELYEGCVLRDELIEFLKSQGFYLYIEDYKHSPEWGDAIFLKNK